MSQSRKVKPVEHRPRREERRRLELARERRRRIITWGGVALAVVIVALVAFVIISKVRSTESPIAGVQSFDNLQRTHVTTAVTYPQTPPVGGPHDPVWQNCGYYSKPVRNENGVHVLEHGAVWITYRPDLPADQIDQLRQLARGQTYILVSPYPNLPASVVASAWGKQVQLDSASDSRLNQFVKSFRLGPQTPEPGAVCTGGTGTPE